MSKPRTRIRRMWRYADDMIVGHPTDERNAAVLVIPDNPAARAAMVEKVYMMAHDHGSLSPLRALSRSHIEEILATALTP